MRPNRGIWRSAKRRLVTTTNLTPTTPSQPQTPAFTRLTDRPRMVILGGGLEAPDTCRGRANYIYRALERVNHSVRLAPGWQVAKSGWSMAVTRTMIPLVVAQNPEILVIRVGGGNGSLNLAEDPESRPASGSLWDIFDDIIAQCETQLPNTHIIIGKTQPSGLSSPFAAKGWAYQQKLHDPNKTRRTAGTGRTIVFHGGVDEILADLPTYFIDPQSNYVHFNENAADRFSSEVDGLAWAINQLVEPITIDQLMSRVTAHGDVGNNIETKYLLPGTGSAATGTGATGQVAAGFQVQSNPTGASGLTVVGSKPTDQKMRMTVVGTPGSTHVRRISESTTVPTTSPAGAYFEAVIPFKLDAAQTALSLPGSYGAQMTGLNGTAGGAVIQTGNYKSPLTVPREGVLVTQPSPTTVHNLAQGVQVIVQAEIDRPMDVGLTVGRDTGPSLIIRQVELRPYTNDLVYLPGLVPPANPIWGGNYIAAINTGAVAGGTATARPGLWSGGNQRFRYAWNKDGVAGTPGAVDDNTYPAITAGSWTVTVHPCNADGSPRGTPFTTAAVTIA